MDPLAGWHDFFLLCGGAAATLLGLVFIATTITASMPREKLPGEETRALWGLPLVYAFVRVIFVAAVGVAPGLSSRTFGEIIAVLGALDTARMVFVARGLVDHHRSVRALVGSDWRWYVVYPLAATVGMLGAGVALANGHAEALYVIGAGLLAHLLIGIHNSWDIADFLAALR